MPKTWNLVSELFLILKSTILLALRLLRAIPVEGWQHVWKRIPLFLIIWVIHALLNLIHIIGHILDELLFYGYKKSQVKRPVFIVGIPRSGTTLLQRIMAEDDALSTFQTWEALFAPSVTEKYLFRCIGNLLKPFAGIMLVLRKKLFGQMDQIHEIRIKASEEDFLLLLPLEACFLLVLLCPNSRHYWNLAAFDKKCDRKYRKTVIHYYHRCLKKHLFFHGTHLRLLSKNPSFTPFLCNLRREFPDADFIGCVRPPEEVIPSQLNSLRPAMQFLSGGRCNAEFERKLIAVLHSYYLTVKEQMNGQRFKVLPLQELKNSLKASLINVFEFLELPVSEKFMNALERHDADAKAYQSHYKSQTKKLALNAMIIQQRFQQVWPLGKYNQGELS